MFHKVTQTSLSIFLYILGTSAAQAGMLGFNFDLTFSSGPLTNQQYTGYMTLEGFEGKGTEVFSLSGSSPAASGKLLSFDISINGTSFGINDVIGSPDSPVVTMEDGELVGISLDALSTADLGIDYEGLSGSINSLAEYDEGGDSGLSSGSVNYGTGTDANDAGDGDGQTGSLRSGSDVIGDMLTAQVPEPTVIALMTLGFTGMTLARRRRL
jgi:hypothetical protein